MIIGYAMIANRSGNISRQIKALSHFGCQEVFTDEGTGVKLDRPSYTKMMLKVQQGDVVMVYSLDRLSRNLFEIREIVCQLYENGIGFVSLKERVNTTTGENIALLGL